MKKVTILVLLAFALSLVPAQYALANDSDLKAIKKAVKENPKVKPGQEVKWFKVLITDAKTKKIKVRVTLPISLIELILKAEDEHINIDRDEYDVDVKEIFAELKKAGPMAIIEVYEEDEIIKVWFE